jgi:hypothetical protein
VCCIAFIGPTRSILLGGDRSEYFRKAISDLDLLYFSYETFCSHPEKCLARVMKICPELVSVSCSQPIGVKDYPEQGISNQNPRQLGLLTGDDIDIISVVLGEHVELLEFFGYPLR